MNIFDSGLVKVYDPTWKLVESRPFNDEEKASIIDTSVVQGEYGLSVCLTLVAGKAYIPLSKDSKLGLSEKLNIDTCSLLTFTRKNRDGLDETCVKVIE